MLQLTMKLLDPRKMADLVYFPLRHRSSQVNFYPFPFNSKSNSHISFADGSRQDVYNSIDVDYRSSFSHKRSNIWIGPRRRVCFRCGGSNHIVKDCRNKIRCFNCGGLGHRKICCSELYRGKSDFAFLHVNCSRLCQKLISFINLYELTRSNEKDEGSYMLLLLCWHFEGLVDGLLWRKSTLGVSSNGIYPPLPRPPERKEHAFSFWYNFLNLKRIFSNSFSKHKKKGVRLLNDIQLLFVFISISVFSARGEADFLGMLEGDDDISMRHERSSNQKVFELRSDIISVSEGDMVFDLHEGSLFCEDMMVDTCERNFGSRKLDVMVLDPFVQSCEGSSAGFVDGRGFELLRDGGGNELMMVMGADTLKCSSSFPVIDTSSILEDVGSETLVARDLRLSNCFGVVSHLDEGEGYFDKGDSAGVEMLSAEQDDVMTFSAISKFGSLKDSSLSMPLSEKGFSEAGRFLESSVRVGADFVMLDDQVPVVVSVVNEGMQNIISGKFSQVFGLSKEFRLANKGVSSFSKRYPVAYRVKRKSFSSVMKHNLWLAMHKSLCVDSVLSGLSNYQASDGLREDYREESFVCDMSSSRTRRGRRRRDAPSLIKVRRSARIRSYAESFHG